MATKVKKKSSGSKVFPIVITVVVIAMTAVIVITVAGNKKTAKKQSKIVFSTNPTTTPVTINGKIGETKLPSDDSTTTPGANTPQDPAVGLIVPQINAQDFTGKQVTITPGKKPYVIAIVAHWCPYCNQEVPSLVKLHDNGQLPKNVNFVAVATASRNTGPESSNYPPSTWLIKLNWPWSRVADDQTGTLASNFGLSGLPYMIYVNANGTVYARTSGVQDDSTVIANTEAISQSKPTA